MKIITIKVLCKLQTLNPQIVLLKSDKMGLAKCRRSEKGAAELIRWVCCFHCQHLLCDPRLQIPF